jgi:hypothetical protein
VNRIRQPSPALIVAVLALVAAIGGTALAGTDATTSASVKKQIKNLKKRVTALENQGQVPGPQGPPGEQGEPGQDATNLFAYIRDNGAADTAIVQYGSGVTAVSDSPATAGSYTVTFNRSVQNCVAQANAGIGDPAGAGATFSSASFASVDLNIGGADQLLVDVFDTTPAPGAHADSSFLISVFC